MAKRSTESKWRARVQAQERSGLTQPAWCKREGIGLSSLALWRKRLRGSGGVGASRGAGLVPIVVRRESVVAEPTSAMVEVLIDSAGVILRATLATDPVWLASLLRGLR